MLQSAEKRGGGLVLNSSGFGEQVGSRDRKVPSLVVFTTLFPNENQPGAGLFIRERMFRVGQHLRLVVVAPVPWFPFQSLIRRFWPHFRPPAPREEVQDGFEVYHPRFLSFPGVFKSLDGLFLALGALPTMLRIRKHFDFDLIDSHFAYPDGYAATLLGKWLHKSVTITLRGTEIPLSKRKIRRKLILKALDRARLVFSVSGSLKQHAVSLGAEADKIRVVGNGVDTRRFHPIPKEAARAQLGIPVDAQVLVSVGGLVERKGFHRVIEVLPNLRVRFPGLKYIAVGGSNPEGDWSERLKQQVRDDDLEDVVMFLGPKPPDELSIPLSASDVFVLATRNEGWANVFLEAMACGLPVVTTRVGGNAEVVDHADLGTIVPFGDVQALESALAEALTTPWDRTRIIGYAEANSWDQRVSVLLKAFAEISEASGS